MRRHAGLVPICILLVQMGWSQPTMFPPVRGTREMVAAANNFEVEAGYRMLTPGEMPWTRVLRQSSQAA